MLREKHVDVSIIDANAERLSLRDLARRASGADMAFVTSSTYDKWVCPNTELEPFLQAVLTVKSVVARVVVVGVHGTVRPLQMLKATDAYAVVVGEPEGTMVELALTERREGTRGVAYLDHNRRVQEEQRPLLDLSALPPPAMDLLPLDRYRYEVLGDRLMILETTRGCPHSCTFCMRAMYGGRAFRKKRTEQVCRELRDAVLTYEVKSIYLMDIEFTIDRIGALAVCDCLEDLDRDIRWCCQTRADSLDADLVERMKETGCRLVHFGVESGSDRILKRIGKGETTDQIVRGIRMVQEAGMETACFFMFGFPGETRQEMEETIQFARKLAPTYASFHVVEPYPETPLAREVKDSIDGEFFPFVYRFPGVDLKSIQRRALLKFYLRPSYFVQRVAQGGWSMLARQMKIFLDYLR
jgi:anaerobic magnesium-protoporphyrin IX monomethyl ester cyclase